MSLFGAGWTLGSIAGLAGAGGLHSLTYYETTGWRGVLETEKGSPMGDRFPSVPGGAFPVFHALADIAGHRRILPVRNSDRRASCALALEGDGGCRLLIAGFLPTRQVLRLRAPSGRARVRFLDGRTMEEAISDPETYRARRGEILESHRGIFEIPLEPCAIARIDFVESPVHRFLPDPDGSVRLLPFPRKENSR
jgi:hypothetical protein